MKKVIYIENNQEKEIDLDNQKEMDQIGIKMVHDEVATLNHTNSWKHKIMGITPLVVMAVFLFFGFTEGLWHPLWVLFFIIPMMSTILYSKKFLSMGLIIVLVVASYMLMGIFLEIWHPGWLIFFIIPIAGILIGENNPNHRWKDF